MTLLSILFLGFFLGMRHATDSDHVVAVTTIVSRQRQIGTAAMTGIFWGIGHSITLLVVGGAIILFGVVIPERLGMGLEFCVALMLILLGWLNLRAFRRSVDSVSPNEHVHEHIHRHGDFIHSHPHGHDPENHGHTERRSADRPFRSTLRSVALLSYPQTDHRGRCPRSGWLCCRCVARLARYSRSNLGPALPVNLWRRHDSGNDADYRGNRCSDHVFGKSISPF